MIVDEIPKFPGIRCLYIGEEPDEYRLLSDVTLNQETNVSF
jgi:hypothetical protein